MESTWLILKQGLGHHGPRCCRKTFRTSSCGEGTRWTFGMMPMQLGLGSFVSLCFALSIVAYRRGPEGRTHPRCLIGWDLLAWMLLLSIAMFLSIVVAYTGYG